ncbi:MAG: DUF2946 family protein [Rhodoferax sp.]|uniref:DUF2946 family protein n=1 Tax=Rhodoferax sp. TaxID=50421 RepID=UPI00260CDCAB|nr:DUF2946 family protein [Rhodoferax sp.]MDD2881251.1 DUF2946 family protein [Rhodoferax sp.]
MSSRHRHMMTTPHRPWAVWLALCMALLGALAPTVSHALNWAQGERAPLIEICTSVGPRWTAFVSQADATDTRLEGGVTDAATPLDSTPDPSSRTPNSAAVLAHCPFCMLMADRIAPPPQPQHLCFAASGHTDAPVSPPLTCLPAQVLAASQPRGPPAF